MKHLSILFLILTFLFSYSCKPTPNNLENDLTKRNCTEIEECEAEVWFDSLGNPLAHTVRIKKNGKLRFVRGEGVEKAIFIIPKADSLFKNLHYKANENDSLVIGNTTYLFINLIDKKKSKQFEIKDGAIAKPYPYSVYLPGKDKMAESKSSPEIIVEP